MLNCIIATMGANSGMKAPRTAQFVHPAQAPFGVAVLEHADQGNADWRPCRSQLVVDQMQIGRHKPHRVGVQQSSLCASASSKIAQQVHGSVRNVLTSATVDPVLHGSHRAALPFLRREQARQHGFGVCKRRLLRGQENRGSSSPTWVACGNNPA